MPQPSQRASLNPAAVEQTMQLSLDRYFAKQIATKLNLDPNCSLVCTANTYRVQAEIVRQHLYELRVMDLLIRNIGLEAELNLATAVPLSSTVTSAHPPAPPSIDPIAATTAMTPSSLSHIGYEMSHKESFGKLSSRLRLPSLPPNSTRSPKISAGHPGLDSGLALVKAAEAGSARQKLPPDFVSKGDLEEDMQQLLEMDSQVYPTCIRQLRMCLML